MTFLRSALRGAAALCAAAALAGSWPHYAGTAARNAVSSLGPEDLTRICWVATPLADEEFVGSATPIAFFGRVVVNARVIEDDVHVANRLIAFSALTGARLWAQDIQPDVLDSWASPGASIHDASVLIASGATLYAFALSDGAALWSAPLGQSVVNASVAVSSDLLVNQSRADRAFITTFSLGAAALFAFNVAPFHATDNPYQPGELVWSQIVGPLSGATPAYRGGRVVVATTDGRIVAYDALAGGAPLWSTAASASGFFGGVALVDGYVYAATYNFSGGPNSGRLYKLKMSDGLAVWNIAAERTDSIPILAPQGRIYLSGGIDGFGSAPRVQCFRDAGAAAELLWQTPAAMFVGGWTHQPLYADGKLYAGIGSPLGDFEAFEELLILDVKRVPTDPAFVIDSHVGSGGAPSVYSDKLYSIGFDGLFAFQIELGEEPPDSTGDIGGVGAIAPPGTRSPRRDLLVAP